MDFSRKVFELQLFNLYFFIFFKKRTTV